MSDEFKLTWEERLELVKKEFKREGRTNIEVEEAINELKIIREKKKDNLGRIYATCTEDIYTRSAGIKRHRQVVVKKMEEMKNGKAIG